MGNTSTSDKKHMCKTTISNEKINNEEIKKINNEEIKKIIKKYEHVKNNKHITNIDTIVDIMKNTDWDRIEEEIIIPSAPFIPVAQIIMDETIGSNEIVQVAKII